MALNVETRPAVPGLLEAATPELLGLGLKDRWGGGGPGQDRRGAEGSGPPCWTPPRRLALPAPSTGQADHRLSRPKLEEGGVRPS